MHNHDVPLAAYVKAPWPHQWHACITEVLRQIMMAFSSWESIYDPTEAEWS